MPTYFPGAPPGADPFHTFEAAFARKLADVVPGYPLGYYGQPAAEPAHVFVPLPESRPRFASRIRIRRP